jgi:hypothetical protein
MGDHVTTESAAATRTAARQESGHGFDGAPASETHDLAAIITAAEQTSVTEPTGYFKIPGPIRHLLHVP